MTNYRLIALERDHGICVICGSKKRIHVHHQDHNRTHNTLNNLICLCIKCHIKIHRKTIAFPHKKKIIEMRRAGASLGDIAMWLKIGTRAAVWNILNKARKTDESIEIDCWNNIKTNPYTMRNWFIKTHPNLPIYK